MRMTAKEYNQTIAPSETKEQIALVGLLNQVKYNGQPLRFAAIPNGGFRNKKNAAILKRMGVRPGVPDILIFDSPPNYPMQKGAALEMKCLSGGTVSPEQQDWLDYFNSNGWMAGVAKGLDGALALLRNWGYIK